MSDAGQCPQVMVDRRKRASSMLFRPLENGFKLLSLGNFPFTIRFKKIFPFFITSIFTFLNTPLFYRGPRRIIGSKSLLNDAKNFSPDLILSVHAHLNHGYFRLIRDSLPAKKGKFVIFCGELDDGHGFSRHWINPEADLFAGPFEETCRAAVRRGMPERRPWQPVHSLGKPFTKRPVQANAMIFSRNSGFPIRSKPMFWVPEQTVSIGTVR